MNSRSAFDWKASYDSFHTAFPGTQRTPVIGITGNFGEKGCELAEGYYESVLRAGATPVVLPPTEDADALCTMLDGIDALVLSGGGDMNPLFAGEEPVPQLHSINPKRDLCELLLIRLAYDRQLPMLGICRGIQMLAIALDGSVWQDIATQFTPQAPLLKHSQDLERTRASHTVAITEGSLLHSIMGASVLAVNSFHHQAVREAGPHLRVSAIAPDGVIEAVESTEYKSIIGVQWHPECFCLRGDESMMPLFRWLKDEAANYREARRLHSRILTLDSHCDTPMFFDQDIHFDQRDPKILVDLHKMTEGGLDASTMVAYIPQGPLTEEGRKAATAYAKSQLTRVEKMVEANATAVALAYTPKELYQLKDEGRKAIMLGIENGYAIGQDLTLLEYFYKKFGIVYMTLCHNGNNDICGSARPRDGEQLMGVTDFGADVIREMNRLGVMVDLSHASERSFYDALDISQAPIVCSHSSSRALCDHPRNLTDDQLRALAAKGGVAQVTFYNGFLRTDGQATILDAVAHLNHMVDVMGVEHVGIGTDFDGDGGVPGLASASELINFTRRLLRERYSEADLRLIWGGNWLRCMNSASDGLSPCPPYEGGSDYISGRGV
ncbi:MAG: gamma-glutamyl-gamma-aminobutyrate hydrolase family protein [Bacteroidaceae bacterium]|nr:gamma-glutamyl-gamma-aminobutyrate hydrolase family protein [Bacteroidaceae bacterium]